MGTMAGSRSRAIRLGPGARRTALWACAALGAVVVASGAVVMARVPASSAGDARDSHASGAGRTAPRERAARRAPAAFGGLPVAFEENVGQSAEDVRFIARGGASSVHLEQNAAVFWVAASAPPASARAGLGRPATQAPTRLRMTLAHARAASELVGEQVLEGRANYLIGNDPARWKRDVRRYEQVRMRGAYDGIDVVFHGGEGHALEYDFVVQRGADPGKIELGFEDAERVVVGASGELRIELGAETVTMKAPVSYQIVGTERRAVASAYVVRDRHARLELGAYDPELELVVDPLIQFSTFLGGTGGERVTCLARDTAGNLYLSGSTTSANFPKQGALDAGGALRGDVDAFVTKLNPSGSSVLYSTYLGGSSDEGIASPAAHDLREPVLGA